MPLGVVWLAAERLGIMEGRQLIAISMVEVLFLAVLGWRLWRALSGPLLYLYFLVPFGDFLTPKLQDITTVVHPARPRYAGHSRLYRRLHDRNSRRHVLRRRGLRRLAVPDRLDRVRRLYALLMYRSPMRRIVFIVASIIVPIIANGIRALGIVALGHVLGSAQAAATDHVLYGWIFFSLVILLLIALGLPFREDGQPEPVNCRPCRPIRAPPVVA